MRLGFAISGICAFIPINAFAGAWAAIIAGIALGIGLGAGALIARHRGFA